MSRPARLSAVGGLRVQPHRASSAALSGAYPFLAAGPPRWGVPVGVDVLSGAPFAYDPWALYGEGWLTNPNLLLAGVIGQGKSALAKTLALRSVAAGRRVYVAGDPKGEWSPVADAVGGQVVALGAGSVARLNPLDLPTSTVGDRTEAHARRLRLVSSLAQQALGRALRPVEHTVLDEELAHVAARRAPTLGEIVEALLARVEPLSSGPALSVAARDARDLAHALRRVVSGDLAGVFDGRSTVRLDPAAPVVVMDLSRMAGNDDAVALAMTCGAAWLEAATGPGAGKRWIVYDEAWRMLRSLPLLRHMQAQWKLSRALGIANLLVLHRLSDLDAAGAAGSELRAIAEGLLSDCSTRVIYRQEHDQLEASGAAFGLTETERDVITRLPRGVGLWKLPGRSYVIRHDLHPDEQSIVDSDAAMRDNPRVTSPDHVWDAAS